LVHKGSLVGAIISYVLGGLLLAGGFICYNYWGGEWHAFEKVYPFRELAIPLMILGVVLIAVASVLISFPTRE